MSVTCPSFGSTHFGGQYSKLPQIRCPLSDLHIFCERTVWCTISKYSHGPSCPAPRNLLESCRYVEIGGVALVFSQRSSSLNELTLRCVANQERQDGLQHVPRPLSRPTMKPSRADLKQNIFGSLMDILCGLRNASCASQVVHSTW